MIINSRLYWYSSWKPYRALFGRGYTCNVFVLKDNDNLWLFDPGPAVMFKFKLLIKAMKKDGLNPKKVSKIFITHGHSDHTAGLLNWIDYSHPTVYIHERDQFLLKSDLFSFWEREFIEAGDLRKDFFPLKARTLAFLSKYPIGDVPKYKNAVSLHNNEIISGDDISIKTIYTPGHTQGHCSFYCPEIKSLISGDLIDPHFDHKTSLNFPTSDYDEIVYAVNSIKDLKINYFCAAHATKVYEGQEYFDSLIQGVFDKLEFAKTLVVSLLKENKSMRIKEFRRKFPKEVWQLPEHSSVAYSVIKHLIKKEIVIQKDKNFFINN